MYQYRFDMLRHNILLFFMLQRYAIIPIRQNNYEKEWCCVENSFSLLGRSIKIHSTHFGNMWNGKADNNRFILFPGAMTDKGPDALPSPLSPQFSHCSPIVLPFQKENWGRTEVEGRKKVWPKGSAKGRWAWVGEDSRKRASVEKGWRKWTWWLICVRSGTVETCLFSDTGLALTVVSIFLWQGNL